MRWRGNLGISLVEYAVALAVAAVGAIYAAPMFYLIANNHRATAYTNELVAALTFARVQAVTQGHPVSVCSSDNATSCTDTPWAHGYIVFSDTGKRGIVDAGDSIMRRQSTPQPRVNVTLSGASYVSFRPSGAAMAWSPDTTSPELSVARTGLGYWLDRLSPLPAAHADTGPMGRTSSSTGVFTVCVGRAGRVVKLSPQGSISTNAVDCR